MFIEMKGLREERAHVAVHGKMELRIVPLNSIKELVYADFRIQLLPDFAG